MKPKLIATMFTATFVLTACTGSMINGGSMQGMNHGQMMSGTMSNTMPMSGTMPMNHDNMGDMQGMSGMMDEMMAHMQGMLDGSAATDPTAMASMMTEMDSMMQMMSQMHNTMMNGSMAMTEESMAGMTPKMDSMMQMMEQMHEKMMDGSMPMDEAHMEKMKSHMAEMDSMMQTMHGAMGHSMPMTGTMPMSDTMAGMDHAAMSQEATMPFDAQFIDGMIVHHQGAVTMANELLQNTERPEMKAFAEAIISAQSKEIADMQGWRQAWYPDLAATAGMDMSMGDMQVSSDESKSYDQRFLEAMISHHQGAIEMAQMAQHMAEHTEIKTLADAIITAQEAEIAQMEGWLKEWFNVE